MGQDGMLGAKAIREKGGLVLSQEPSSCAVYGMPKAVAEAGISQASLNLLEMARSMMDLSLDSQGLNT
jgi:two-component system, chemotaxis family, protein-glutamate methylesterase/glutaminase